MYKKGYTVLEEFLLRTRAFTLSEPKCQGINVLAKIRCSVLNVLFRLGQ